MVHYLGIDIGGTNVKFGVVTKEGELISEAKYPTPTVFNNGQSIEDFIAIIKDFLVGNTTITSVGIGVPGTLTADKRGIVTLNNIPQLNGLPLITLLEKAFPGISFYAENDANAAAMGQYYFSNENNSESLLFLTLGTGVGAALILNGKLFLGEGGNAMELHNTPYKKGKGYEYYLGKKGWAREYNKLYKKKTGEIREELLTPKEIVALVNKKDRTARKLMKQQGKALGELIATAIRYFDIRVVYIGGGVASVFPEMEKACFKSMSLFLEEYYLKGLIIKTSELKNKAGVLGAAALCLR